jgi:hypothetical protein
MPSAPPTDRRRAARPLSASAGACLLAVAAAAFAPPARAQDPSPGPPAGPLAQAPGPATAPAPAAPGASDLSFIRSRQVWGWTGVGFVGGGAALSMGGAVMFVGGVDDAVLEGDVQRSLSGALLAVAGGTVLYVGLPLASSAALHGAHRANAAGLPVRTTAGWISVGALGGSVLALALPDPAGVLSPILMVTSVGAAAGQLVGTRSALRASGLAALPPERPRLQLALVPTGTGAALAGAF